jgi:hypothetical protein
MLKMEGVMGKEENIGAQVKFGEAVVSGKLEGLREVVEARALDHDPGPGRSWDLRGSSIIFRDCGRGFRI